MPAETYRITVKGHLDGEWSDWFDGLTVITTGNGETILTGPIVDQTALHGVLLKIRDLGLPLLALTRLADGSHVTISLNDAAAAGSEGCRWHENSE